MFDVYLLVEGGLEATRLSEKITSNTRHLYYKLIHIKKTVTVFAWACDMALFRVRSSGCRPQSSTSPSKTVLQMMVVQSPRIAICRGDSMPFASSGGS